MDRYDQEVKKIQQIWKNNEKYVISTMWGVSDDGSGQSNSPLFAYVTPSRSWYQLRPQDNLECGCVTQIHCAGTDEAFFGTVGWTDELTELIKADPNIPNSPRDVTPENAVHIAELQREIDRILQREPPPLLLE